MSRTVSTSPPIHILMIGDCTLATSYMPHHLCNQSVLHGRLIEAYPHDHTTVTNEGLDAESVAGFLRRYDRTFADLTPPDYIFVRYGVNDRRDYGVDGFRKHLHTLLARLRADFPAVRMLLETGIYVDYPQHYEFDRNTVLQPIYDVVRRAAHAYDLPLVDLYQRMAYETAQGNWDLRVRGYGVVDEDIPVLGAGQDHLHGGDVRWFTNIHPNPKGIAVFADEEVQVLQEHWPVTLRYEPELERAA